MGHGWDEESVCEEKSRRKGRKGIEIKEKKE